MILPEVDNTKLVGVQRGLGKPTFGWHIIERTRKCYTKPYTKADYRLKYNDNRVVRTKRVLSVKHPSHINLCTYGMHASPTITGAMSYIVFTDQTALCKIAVYNIPRVDCYNEEWNDTLGPKFVGQHREVLFMLRFTQNDIEIFENIVNKTYYLGMIRNHTQVAESQIQSLVVKRFYKRYTRPLYWEKNPR